MYKKTVLLYLTLSYISENQTAGNYFTIIMQ